MSKNFLKSSIENASLNIILQISFRIITFLLNAFVVRHVSSASIGVMYVRLLLLESTILFLSRDAFRKACLSKTEEHDWKKVINLIWLTLPISAVLSVFFGYVWLYVFEQPDLTVTTHYRIGVFAIAISCIVEICCEPLYLVSQAFLLIQPRIWADILSMLVRTISFVLLILISAENAVLAFSVAQILSVCSYVLVFYVYFAHIIVNKRIKDKGFPFRQMNDIIPKNLKSDEQIDWKLLSLVWRFSLQGVMMQILTEGERYIMTLSNVFLFAEQGIFDIVNNLGSLAARFVFRPIEESSYFYFSQLIHRDERINEQSKTKMEEAAFVLQNLLRCVISLGLIVLCFGQSYARLALFLYGGMKLASGLGPKLLRTHCVAILLMAVNGSTECYALSTMDKQTLNRHNRIMVVFAVFYLCLLWMLSYYFGSVGFILANCINMSARIVHSIFFIRERYQNTNYISYGQLLPKKYFLTALAFSTVITLVSQEYLWERKILHFLIGAICFLLTLLMWYYEEQELIHFFRQNRKTKKN